MLRAYRWRVILPLRPDGRHIPVIRVLPVTITWRPLQKGFPSMNIRIGGLAAEAADSA